MTAKKAESKTGTKKKTTRKAAQASQKKGRARRKAAQKPQKARPARPARPQQPVTSADKVFEVLPATLQDITYVQRTRDILDKRHRRAEKLRRDTKKDVRRLVEDMRADARGRVEARRDQVKERVDDMVTRARQTSVGQRVERIPDQLTERFDGLLDRVGLVRKAEMQRMLAESAGE